MTNQERPRSMTDEEKLRLMYDVALAQLRLHPTLIWTRNSFFLLTQTGLLAFVSNMLTRQFTKPLLLAQTGICLAGFFVAFIWLRVNQAGQTLQSKWGKLVRDYEMELFEPENQTSEAKTKLDVSAKRGPFLQSDVGENPSVSITEYLVKLSKGFLILWIALSVCCVLALIFSM